MTADKRGYEYLIFQAQSRQLRKLKGALNSDVLIHDPHPLHHDWLPFRELRQLLPVTCHSLTIQFCLSIKLIIKLIKLICQPIIINIFAIAAKVADSARESRN